MADGAGAAWDESKHPREAAGTTGDRRGGEFAPLEGSAGGHPGQIATAQSVAKKKGQRLPITTYYQPSVKLMQDKAPKLFESVLKLFHNPAEFPNFRPDMLKGSKEDQAKAIVREMADNLKFEYQHANEVRPGIVEGGNIWYESAHRIGVETAQKNGFDHPDVKGSAVVARMSPQTEWDMNIEMAKRMMNIYATKQDKAWDSYMTAQSPKTLDPTKGSAQGDKLKQRIADFAVMRGDIEGKTLGQVIKAGDPVNVAAWIRVYDESRYMVPHNEDGKLVVHTDYTSDETKPAPKGAVADPSYKSRDYPAFNADGSEGPIRRNDPSKDYPEGKPKPFVWGPTTTTLADCVRILQSNGDPRIVSAYLTDAHKVRSFNNNILDPHSPNQDVTIDTHQVRGALFRRDVEAAVNQNFGNNAGKGQGVAGKSAIGIKGSYPFYADATRLAAKELGVPYAQMVQAVTWNVAREVLSGVSDKNSDAIEGVWKDFHDGKIKTSDEAREQTWKIAMTDYRDRQTEEANRVAKIRENAPKRGAALKDALQQSLNLEQAEARHKK